MKKQAERVWIVKLSDKAMKRLKRLALKSGRTLKSQVEYMILNLPGSSHL